MKALLVSLLCIGIFGSSPDSDEGFGPEKLLRTPDSLRVQTTQDSLIALHLETDEPRPLIQWLQWEIVQNRSSSALQVLQSLLPRQDVQGIDQFHAAMAWALQKQGKYKKALPYAQKTLALNPQWCFGTGNFWVKYLEARANPLQSPHTFLDLNTEVNLRHKKETQGNPDQIQAWEKLRRELSDFMEHQGFLLPSNDPWLAQLCLDLGDLYFLTGENEDAKLWWQKAQELNPDFEPNIQDRKSVLRSSFLQYFTWWKILIGVLVLGGLAWWLSLSASIKKTGK